MINISLFVNIIKKAKEIMSNYYINEKKLIKPLVDKFLKNKELFIKIKV